MNRSRAWFWIAGCIILCGFAFVSTCVAVENWRVRNFPRIDSTRPAIIGNLEQGKYSNPVIGFEIQLDQTCAFADESSAITWSTEYPQRLSLWIRCGRGNLVFVSSFPLHAEEDADLAASADPSLQGVIDGGGFKKRGGWQSQKIGGIDLLLQELTRHGDSGEQLGFNYAFLVGRRYVNILALGPKANRTELSKIVATLKIEPNH
jgi:hypothetical protein